MLEGLEKQLQRRKDRANEEGYRERKRLIDVDLTSPCLAQLPRWRPPLASNSGRLVGLPVNGFRI
jgi:hypothetical protein